MPSALSSTRVAGRVAIAPALVILLGGGSVARAQSFSSRGEALGSYSAPGAGVEAPLDRREQLESAIEDARWRWGGLRVDPFFGISQGIVVDSGLSGQEIDSDVSLTVDLGLRAYQPLSPKVVLSADVVPGYTLWARQHERSRVQVDAGAAIDAFLNRLQIYFAGSQVENVARASAETAVFASENRTTLAGRLEAELTPLVFLFLDGSETQIESLEDPGSSFDFLARNDRDETTVVAGVRLRPTDILSFDVGLERVIVDFATGAFDRSVEGDAPFVAFTAEGTVTLIQGRLRLRDLKPKPESAFVATDDLAGRLELRRELSWKSTFELQFIRDHYFALAEGYSHFTGDRVRAALGMQLRPKLELRPFVGLGVDDFVPVLGDGAASDRSDDVVEWGVDLSLGITRTLDLRLGYTLEEFDSSLPEFDRDLDRITFGVAYSALGGRLRVQ